MGELFPYLVLAGVLALIIGFFTWLAAVVRRRGIAGAAVRGALAAHDEAFRVTAHDSAYEIQAQAERKVPVLSPGGRNGGVARRPFVPRPRSLRRRLRFRKRRPGRR